MSPNRVNAGQVLAIGGLSPVAAATVREAEALQAVAVEIARTTRLSYEGALDRLAGFYALGVGLDLAERAVRDGFRPEDVEIMREPERPPLTVEEAKQRNEARAERAELRGKWRSHAHAGQGSKALDKRRRRAKLAKASRKRRR